jgi:hypothetical protein
LDQLLLYVERAVRSDRRLLIQLFRTFQQLSSHPSAPSEDRALGEILSRILMGDRQPDLSGLPSDMANEVNDLVERLQLPKESFPKAP